MKKLKYIYIFLSFLAICLSSCKQNYTSCHIYQYLDNDSKNQKLVLKQTFNSQKKVINMISDGYKETPYIENPKGIFTFSYDDTTLVMTTFISHDIINNSLTVNSYNQQNQLTKSIYFEYQDPQKNGVDSIIEGTWNKKNTSEYFYDEKGNKIEYINQNNKYIWTYDSLNRIIECTFYDDERLVLTRKNSYFENGYIENTIWHNNPHIDDDTRIYHFDKKGRMVKEIEKNNKQELVSTITYSYHSEGRRSRKIYSDKDNNPVITHIYKYYNK